MATKFSQKMNELKRVAQLHANWLVYATLGASAISKAELSELKKYGKLPVDKSLDLVDKSYLLGRLKAILKKSEYSKVTYEEVVEKTGDIDLSLLEELVVEQARLKAGTYLKNLSTELNNGVYDALSQSIGKAVSEAMVRGVVSDETALAVIYKKTAQEFSSSLAARLQTGPKKSWLAIAKTELHRAKVAGHAQAIINKIDIYANSDGPNSEVSIIPAKECCEDCMERYTDATGNPKIFKLTDLIAAGSNADSGVSHSKIQGKHVNWKTTLPPLHPNCGCQLQYIPPGYGWQDGKMSVLNKSLFEEALLRKAVAGVSGGISSTVKPKGPYGSAKPPGMPSVAGVAAPGNVAGPGRPPGMSAGGSGIGSKIKGVVSKLFGGGGGGEGGGSAGGGGGNSEYAPCPFGGSDDCIKHGGNGAEHHKANGSIMRKHQQAMSKGAKPKTKQSEDQKNKQKDAEATQYNLETHPNQVVVDHLSDGKIGSMTARAAGQVSANDSFKVTIEGNGSGLMKSAIDFDAQISASYLDKVPGARRRFETKNPEEQRKFLDNVSMPGAGTTAPGMHPNAEAAAHSLSVSLGVGNVPVTVLRHHDGKELEGSPKGLTSVMQWQDEAVSIESYLNDRSANFKSLLEKARPEHKDKIKSQMADLAIFDVIINNNDRHDNNIMLTRDGDLLGIDHGTSCANGLSGHRNDVALAFHKSGEALTVSPDLQNKLRASTLTSTMRSLDSSGLPQWSKAQVFLRQKYIAHLQDAFGHVPFDRIRGTNTSRTGGVQPYVGDVDHWSEGDKNGMLAFFEAQGDKTLPHDQFERWSKDFMTTAAADSSHPDHADAKKLLSMNPLRSSGHVTGREEATPESLSEHFDSISSYSVSSREIDEAKNKLKESKAAAEPPAAEPVREVPQAPLASPEESGSVVTPVVARRRAAEAAAAAAGAPPRPSSEIELSTEDLEEVESPKPKPRVAPPPIPSAPPTPPKKASQVTAEPAAEPVAAAAAAEPAAASEEAEDMDEDELMQERTKFAKDRINAIFSKRASGR